ncbi:MAG TPA: MFS transporter [Deltaproteobacteria bacterium]|nr:MFS transporter [Deltaproteobacteria bacterium]HQB39029.1 MFS transporter [Deltaproteobacteria bacterium]
MTPENRYRQRWIIFTVLALMYILVYFYRVSLAVVADDISRDLQLSPQQLGTLSGILFFVYATAQLPLGPLIDRLGGRVVISVCGVLTALGGLLFSQAASLQTAMLARILIGVGTASTLMATFTIFSHWYEKQEFGRITSLMIAVGNLGNLAATAPLALCVTIFGWRDSFLVIAAAQMAITLLVFLRVRNRPPACWHNQSATPLTEHERPGLKETWRQIFTNRDFWLLAILAFAWYGNYMAVQGLWGGPYLMDIAGLSRDGAGRMLMFTSLGFIAGSMVIDSIARCLFRSHRKTMLVGQICLLLLMTPFLGLVEQMSATLLCCLFFAIGLAVSSGVMIYPLIRNMFPLQIVGTALTSLNFFVLLGAAVVQQTMGLVIGQAANDPAHPSATAFHTAFMLPIALLLAGVILFTFFREPVSGNHH